MGTASDGGAGAGEKEEAEVEEVLAVSAADASKLNGPSGSAAYVVEQRSRATITVERGSAPTVRVRGAPAAVRKALGMLRAMVSFREAAAPEERGLCRWFSSGFCRLAEDGTDGCEDGLHSQALLREAQTAWLAKAPLPGVEAVQGVPLLLAVVCNGPGLRGAVEGEEEVTELGAVALCPTTGREVGRFHRFVRPCAWASDGQARLRQRFHPACFNDECSAVAFTDALADLLDWIPALLGVPLDEIQKEDLLLVTARDFEAQMLLPRQCNLPEPGTVDPALQDFFFCRWACLKDVFRHHFNLDAETAPYGLRAMLRHLGLGCPQERKLTFCMQDCTCMGRILEELLRSGWQVMPTAWRENTTAPVEFSLSRRDEWARDLELRFPPVLGAKRGFEEVERGEGEELPGRPAPALRQPAAEFVMPPPPPGRPPPSQPQLDAEPPPEFPPRPPQLAPGRAAELELAMAGGAPEAEARGFPGVPTPPRPPQPPPRPSSPWQVGQGRGPPAPPPPVPAPGGLPPRPPPPWRSQAQRPPPPPRSSTNPPRPSAGKVVPEAQLLGASAKAARPKQPVSKQPVSKQPVSKRPVSKRPAPAPRPAAAAAAPAAEIVEAVD